MTFGSLFAGIGGMDLGLERAGMTCRWQVEIDPYASRVLARHWPDVPRWGNIKTFLPDTASERFGAWREGRTVARRQRRAESPWVAQWRVDLIAGGFPCQDISYAGKGAGLAGKRSGLWYEFARVVRVLRPRYVLVENVSALLSRGLDSVLGTLASLGYGCEWACLPAAAVGAPHIRDRVFVVAHRDECGLDPRSERPQREAGADAGVGCPGRPVDLPNSDPDRQRFPQRPERDSRPVQPSLRASSWGNAHGLRHDVSDPWGNGLEGSQSAAGEASGLRRRFAFADCPRDEIAAFRDTAGIYQWGVDPSTTPESSVGRMAHGVSCRVDRLRCLGNAVVPQVAEWIGRRILSVTEANA